MKTLTKAIVFFVVSAVLVLASIEACKMSRQLEKDLTNTVWIMRGQ